MILTSYFLLNVLESIQISMRTRKDVCWMKGYLALKQYVEDYGDTLVPSLYCTETGFGLGDWVKNVKTKYKKHQLTKQQIAMLDEFHFDWGNLQKAVSEKHWNAYYERAKAYYEEHGNLCVPEKYVTEDGYALGYWMKLQRGVKKGTQKAGISYDSKRIKLMDDIGMVWYGTLKGFIHGMSISLRWSSSKRFTDICVCQEPIWLVICACQIG